jgi:hypothetical protein
MKTLRKTVVAAMTDTTSANGSAMMFITGFRRREAMTVCTRFAPKAAQKYPWE